MGVPSISNILETKKKIKNNKNFFFLFYRHKYSVIPCPPQLPVKLFVTEGQDRQKTRAYPGSASCTNSNVNCHHQYQT